MQISSPLIFPNSDQLSNFVFTGRDHCSNTLLSAHLPQPGVSMLTPVETFPSALSNAAATSLKRRPPERCGFSNLSAISINLSFEKLMTYPMSKIFSLESGYIQATVAARSALETQRS